MSFAGSLQTTMPGVPRGWYSVRLWGWQNTCWLVGPEAEAWEGPKGERLLFPSAWRGMWASWEADGRCPEVPTRSG